MLIIKTEGTITKATIEFTIDELETFASAIGATNYRVRDESAECNYGRGLKLTPTEQHKLFRELLKVTNAKEQ